MALAAAPAAPGRRNIAAGHVIPDEGYCDQPYVVVLDDGSWLCTMTTGAGVEGQAGQHIAATISRDNGRTWTPPGYATYTPGGRPIKQPRAFGLMRRFSNGRYLLWFHNHGGEAVLAKENWQYYLERNPGWVWGGVERGGRIWWSKPEILLYDDDPAVRISYPDFIEDNGRYYITETQKEIARVHEIDRALLEGLWSQSENRSAAPGHAAAMPELPELAAGGARRRGTAIRAHIRARCAPTGASTSP
jgi:hypothetical protein